MNCIEAWVPGQGWCRYCGGIESMVEAACLVTLLREIAPDIRWRISTH